LLFQFCSYHYLHWSYSSVKSLPLKVSDFRCSGLKTLYNFKIFGSKTTKESKQEGTVNVFIFVADNFRRIFYFRHFTDAIIFGNFELMAFYLCRLIKKKTSNFWVFFFISNKVLKLDRFLKTKYHKRSNSNILKYL
jgi:hypothetical protein